MNKNFGLNDRAGLAAWYRYRMGVVVNSLGVSSWPDQSGNTRPLLQATDANRPPMTSDGSVLFDGVSDYLQAAFTLIQPFSVYLALTQVTWTSGDVVFDGATGTTKLTQTSTTPQLALNGGSALAGDSTLAVGRPGVIAAVFNSTSSVYQVGGGGAVVTVTGDAGANNPGGITLGAAQAPGNYANIAVREMIVYSVAHDAPTRLRVLRYLARIAQVGGV